MPRFGAIPTMKSRQLYSPVQSIFGIPPSVDETREKIGVWRTSHVFLLMLMLMLMWTTDGVGCLGQ